MENYVVMKMVELQPKRKFELDFLRAISTMAVVYLHANGCFWEEKTFNTWVWFSANVIECVCYFAVPVFFMLSGITLINYTERYSTKEFLKHRVIKTLVPYIIWTFFGALYYYLQGDISGISCKYILNGLLTGSSVISIYWFFPVLFGIYLCMPLYANVNKDKRKDVFLYLSVIGIVINSGLPFVNEVFNLQLSSSMTVGVVAQYMIWPVLGYLLYYYPLKKNTKMILYIMAAIGLIIQIVGTQKIMVTSNAVSMTYKGYNNIPSIFYSIGIFMFLCSASRWCARVKILRQIVELIAKYSFPIYLMHWYIVNFINRYNPVVHYSLKYRLIAPIGIAGACILIADILRKIPIVKCIVP